MAYVREKELGFLKFFVYFMVFILMFGLLILTYIVYKKNYNILDNDGDESRINHKVEPNCKEGNLELEISDHIDKIYHEKNKIYVLTKPGHKQELVIIDHCRKKVLGRISFKIPKGHDHFYDR